MHNENIFCFIKFIISIEPLVTVDIALGAEALVRHWFIVRHETDSLANNFIFEASGIEIPALNVVVLSLCRKPDYSNYCAVFLRRLEILFNSLQKEIKSKYIFISADFNLNIAEKRPSEIYAFKGILVLKSYFTSYL